MSLSIPTLDISRFESDRENFLKELGAAYEEWGFAGITEHGVDIQVIEDALKISESFFALPTEVKEKYFLDNGGKRGYTPFGKEIAKDAKHVDLKEFWHVGRELAMESQTQDPQLDPNVWPEELPEFKSTMLALYEALDKLANKMLSAFALYLGEEENYFDHRVNVGNSVLRSLHYPPIENTDTQCVRAAEHGDINLITLLVGSAQDGLQVQAKTGEWVPISIIEGTIICNIGDMMQRLTNHVLPSTIHRVVNPEGDAAKYSRYSIPFFVHPNSDTIIDSLPNCVTDENPKRYEPITANEYLEQRLREIGLL